MVSLAYKTSSLEINYLLSIGCFDNLPFFPNGCQMKGDGC
jgi:hypothetical protein